MLQFVHLGLYYKAVENSTNKCFCNNLSFPCNNLNFSKSHELLGVVVYTCNLATQELEVGASLQGPTWVTE